MSIVNKSATPNEPRKISEKELRLILKLPFYAVKLPSNRSLGNTVWANEQHEIFPHLPDLIRSLFL